MEGWAKKKCGCCDGLMWCKEGFVECKSCNGAGFYFIHIKSGVEAEQDVKDKRKTCLNCQMLRPTTDSKVKLCGSYFQKGSLFSQPTSIVFLKNHCCQNHVSF